MDRSGSHVAETALKSLARHLQDSEVYTIVEDTLRTMCKVIVDIPVDLTCNCNLKHVISFSRTMELIWEELGLKFGDLLGMGRSGVIASLTAACQRLQTHEYKCCQALAAAFDSENESSKCIVTRIIFLDRYFSCGVDKANWNWAEGAKIHVMLVSKTRQGPHLLRKLDIDTYDRKPDQWRSKQASKQSAYKEFYSTFTSSELKPSMKNKFISDASMQTSEHEEWYDTRNEREDSLTSTSMGDTSVEKTKKMRKRYKAEESEVAVNSNKVVENAVKNFLSEGRSDKKPRINGRPSSIASKQKLKI